MHGTRLISVSLKLKFTLIYYVYQLLINERNIIYVRQPLIHNFPYKYVFCNCLQQPPLQH